MGAAAAARPGLISRAARCAQQRAWLKQLEQLLATQTASHGGPIAFVEGRVLAIDAAAPPAPVTTISAMDPGAFARSREAMSSARGALLWTDVEDAVYPAGWAANPGPCCAKAPSDSPATSVPPPRRCAAMPRCCAGGRGFSANSSRRDAEAGRRHCRKA